ncbi:MAG: ligand-binding sensor domain-containing protein [Candidatus Cyclobacteriaceae bacterium M3_2C_046]
MNIAGFFPLDSNASEFHFEPAKFNRINAQNGLPNSSVWSVTQDQLGFIWLATSYGLHRFDGVSFKSYIHDPRDNATISSNRIRQVFIDPSGDVWLSTFYGEVNRLIEDRDKFKRYELTEELQPAGLQLEVRFFYSDIQSRLWLGTNRGLWIYQVGDDQFQKVSCPNDQQLNIVYAMAELDNSLWVASDQGLRKIVSHPQDGLIAVNPAPDQSWSQWGVRTLAVDTLAQSLIAGTVSKGAFIISGKASGFERLEMSQFNHRPVFRVIFRTENELWLLSDQKVMVRFIRHNEEFIYDDAYCYEKADPNRKLSHTLIKTLYVDSKEQLWVGTDGGGLNKFFPAESRFLFYKSNESTASLSGNSVVSIFEDHQEGLWIGTFGNGLNYSASANKGFLHYDADPYHPQQEDWLTNELILDFDETPEGKIWIATNGGGLHLFDPANDSFANFTYQSNQANGLPNNKLASVLQSNNQVWIGTSGSGLARLDLSTESFYTYKGDQGLSDIFIYCLFKDQQGNIWAGSRRGIDIYNPDWDKFIPFQEYFNKVSPDTRLTHIWKVFQDRSGMIWIASEGQGLYSFNPDSQVLTNFRYAPDDTTSISSNEVWDICQDLNERIWIATSAGINLLIPGEHHFRAFSANDGLANNTVMSVEVDQNGALWLATKGGLSRFDYDQQNFSNYFQEDGLQGNEFFPASLSTQSGQLYFGGTNGFTRFNPDQLGPTNKYPPPTVITAISLDNIPVEINQPNGILSQPIEYTDQLTFQHNYRILTLEFATLNYLNPAQNQQAYRLLPLEQDWQVVNNQDRAVYTNLDPGSYIFEVKGANNDGVWNPLPSRLHIEILPPWWQTNWAQLGAGFLLALLMVGFTLHRFYQLKIRQLKLEDLVESRTEEIVSQKNAILQQKEAIIRQNKQLEQKNQQLIALNQQKDGLMHVVAHDLKSPLNRLKGLLQIVRGAVKSQKVDLEDVFDLSNKVINDGNQLIRNLLDLHQLEKEGEIKLTISRFNLREILEDIIQTYERQLNQKQINLDINIADLDLESDQLHVTRIIDNLFSNAVKFSPPYTTITLLAEKISGEAMRISIKDEGPGISESEQKHLYQMFSKLSSKPTGGESSHGLGLAIVKCLVIQLKGEISLESKKGKGSNFILVLPMIWPEKNISDSNQMISST